MFSQPGGLWAVLEAPSAEDVIQGGVKGGFILPEWGLGATEQKTGLSTG